MNLILKQRTNLTIYIIEQEPNRDDYDSLPSELKQHQSKMAKFNLGRLKNIGFDISSNENHNDNTYYILSDVDLLPSVQLIDDYLKYPKNCIHLGNKGTRYEENKNDKKFLGGVFSVNKEYFEKCNGYPNNFWGWGGEDDVLLQRIKQNDLEIDNSEKPVIDLEDISLQEKLIDLKQKKLKDMKKIEKVADDQKDDQWRKNGLSNIKESFEIISKSNYNDLDNVEHIQVKLLIQDLDKIY